MLLSGIAQMAETPSSFGVGKLKTSAAGTFNMQLPFFCHFQVKLFRWSVFSYVTQLHAPVEVWTTLGSSVKSCMSAHHDMVNCAMAMQQLEHSDSLLWICHILTSIYGLESAIQGCDRLNTP